MMAKATQGRYIYIGRLVARSGRKESAATVCNSKHTPFGLTVHPLRETDTFGREIVCLVALTGPMLRNTRASVGPDVSD